MLRFAHAACNLDAIKKKSKIPLGAVGVSQIKGGIERRGQRDRRAENLGGLGSGARRGSEDRGRACSTSDRPTGSSSPGLDEARPAAPLGCPATHREKISVSRRVSKLRGDNPVRAPAGQLRARGAVAAAPASATCVGRGLHGGGRPATAFSFRS